MIVHNKHHPFSHPLSVTAERSSCTGHHLSLGFICSDIFRKFEFARQNFSATSSYAKSVWHHTHLVKRFSCVCPFSARTSLPTEKGTNWSMIHTIFDWSFFWLWILLVIYQWMDFISCRPKNMKLKSCMNCFSLVGLLWLFPVGEWTMCQNVLFSW